MKFPAKSFSVVALAGMIAFSAPYSASASETVHFSFQESELATASARENLLARIEKVSARSCRKSSSILPLAGTMRCKDDLKDQLVEAIGNQALTTLAESKEGSIFRSASR